MVGINGNIELGNMMVSFIQSKLGRGSSKKRPSADQRRGATLLVFCLGELPDGRKNRSGKVVETVFGVELARLVWAEGRNKSRC